MLKKGQTISLEGEPTEAFQEIKEAINKAQVLDSLGFSEPFQLYYFTSFYIVIVVLLKIINMGISNIYISLVRLFRV